MGLIDSIGEIIENGQYTNSSPDGGYWVQKFEKSLTDYLKKPTIVVNSGTSALILSLKMADKYHLGNVGIPAYGFIATKRAVEEFNYHLTYYDVKESDYTIDLSKPSKPYMGESDIIITIDLYGNIADHPDYECVVIEDACQALGTIKEIRADYTCFSFYPTKIVNSGEGGAVTFQTEEEAERGRRLRTYPEGINIRMSEINACIGWHNMRRFLNHKFALKREMRPKNWYKHYDYTLSPPGLCPIADKLAKNKLY